MSNTPEMIKLFREKKSSNHYYYPWSGFVGNWVEPWYCAEGSSANGGSISGRHWPTLEEAEADIERLKAQDEEEGRTPYESWRVVKYEPCLKISVAKEIS